MTKLIYDARLNNSTPPEYADVSSQINKTQQETHYHSVEELIKAICLFENCSPIDLQMNQQITTHGQITIWFSKKIKMD